MTILVSGASGFNSHLKCLTCGKEFKVNPFRLKTAKYCSRKCKNEGMRENKNLRYKELEARVCPTCEKLFFVKPGSTRKFCSHDCFIKIICGKPKTLEHRLKISECLKTSHWAHNPEKRKKVVADLRALSLGREPWNKGLEGEGYLSHFKGGGVWNDGLTKKTDERVVQYALKLTESMKGNIPWNKDLIAEEDERVRINVENGAKTRREMYARGEIKPTRYWLGKTRGGLYEPYGPEFNDELREQILERDCYTCQNPNCETIEDLCIHHIDYNKRNNEPGNLITLCRRCNTRANYNYNLWKEMLGRKMICLVV